MTIGILPVHKQWIFKERWFVGVLTTQKVGLTVVDINEPKYSGINCSLQGRKRKNSESLNTGSYHPHHRKSALMTGPSPRI